MRVEQHLRLVPCPGFSGTLLLWASLSAEAVAYPSVDQVVVEDLALNGHLYITSAAQQTVGKLGNGAQDWNSQLEGLKRFQPSLRDWLFGGFRFFSGVASPRKIVCAPMSDFPLVLGQETN